MRAYHGTAAIVLLAATVVAGQPVGGYEDEAEFRFRTSDVVPEKVLSGPNYELDPETSLADGRFVFLVRTKWGVLTAHSRPMLALRLREMDAIERARQLSGEPQLVAGFLSTLVDSRKGAELLLTDPIGSVRRVPAGIGKKIKGFIDPANRRAGGETRRRIAAELECDPETDNPILSRLLDWIALRQGVGGIAGKASLNLVAPGLALIPTTAQLRKLLATRTPAEIDEYVEAELVDAGYDETLVDRFTRESGATSMMRLMIVERLRTLADVPGHDLLLHRAAEAESMADAMRVVHELVLLERLDETRTLTSVRDPGYPLVTLADGGHVVVCADEFRVDDERLREFATGCRTLAGTRSVDWYGPAGFSERAIRRLRNHGLERAATRSGN